MSSASDNVVLEVNDLRTHIFNKASVVKAVDGVSFRLCEGETLGLVGESGCGKTMTALSLLRLVPKPAGKIVSGSIVLNGEDILSKTDAQMRLVRGRQISMILQDPQTSLNPVFTIGDQILEAIGTVHSERKRSMVARAVDALRKVNVAAPERRLDDYPHQMSGGMKQRVVGAIAMSGEPGVIIADEPTTALDVTIQLQYLRLLKEIQVQTGLAIIFITHDFGVVARMCDRVAVMYAGRIVESGAGARHLQCAVPPIHTGAHRLRSQDGGKDRAAGVHRGTAASLVRAAGRLPLRATLSVCHGEVPCRISAPFQRK